MEKTIRQQIVEMVETQLKRIKTTNTYVLQEQAAKPFRTNLGNNIFRWRSAPIAAESTPAGIFRDLDEPVKEASARSPRQMRQLHCQVEIVVLGDTPDDTLRNLLLPDVECAIGELQESGCNGLASDIRPRISRLVTESDTSNKLAGAILEFFIDYGTFAFNPYVSLP